MSRYYLPTATGNQADVYAAAGLARLLLDDGPSPLIVYEDGRYVVETDTADTPDSHLAAANRQVYKYLVTDDTAAPKGLAWYDLPTHRQIETEKREQREVLAKGLRAAPELKRSPEVLQRRQEYAADPEYRLHSVFKGMQAFASANRVLQKIMAKGGHDSPVGEALCALRSPDCEFRSLLNTHFNLI